MVDRGGKGEGFWVQSAVLDLIKGTKLLCNMKYN